MSIKKVVFVVLIANLVASGAMLAVGIGFGFVNVARALPVQSPAAAGAAVGGGPVGNPFLVTSESLEEVSPAVAYNPDREEYLVVWYNNRGGNDDIWAQRVSKAGTLVGGAFCIAAKNGADLRNPDVAYNSAHSQYFVVYEYEDASHLGIRGRIVPGDGSSVGTEITIVDASPGDPAPYHSPAVAYASTADRYLVAFVYFSAYDTVTVASYDHEGNREGVFVSLAGNSLYPIQKPDLAYNRARNEFLVVWQQQVYTGGSSQDKDVYGRRVKMSGGMDYLGDPFAISDDANEEMNPAVTALPNAGSDGRYLVVFAYDNGSAHALRGQAVEGTGTLDFFVTFPYGASSDPQRRPAVAASESAEMYLVTWQQEGYSPPLAYNGIVGRAVAGDGTLLGGSLLDGSFALGGTYADNAAVAAGPLGDFLVVFDDQDLLSSSRDIYGGLWGHRIYLPLTLRNYQ